MAPIKISEWVSTVYLVVTVFNPYLGFGPLDDYFGLNNSLFLNSPALKIKFSIVPRLNPERVPKTLTDAAALHF